MASACSGLVLKRSRDRHLCVIPSTFMPLPPQFSHRFVILGAPCTAIHEVAQWPSIKTLRPKKANYSNTWTSLLHAWCSRPFFSNASSRWPCTFHRSPSICFVNSTLELTDTSCWVENPIAAETFDFLMPD